MADLETLTLQINTESQQTYSAINKLAQRLDNLSVSIAKLEVGKLNDLALGLDNLNTVIYNMNATSSKRDYNKIVRNLSALTSVNVAGLDSLSASLGTLSSAFTNLSGASAVSDSIKVLVSSIGKLGGVSISRAITNIPQLESTLSHLITSFSKLPNINQSVIDFTNSLANLSSQGQRIGSATRSINNSLETFGTSASRATRRSFNLASAIGKVYAEFWIAMRAASGLKKAFKDAADYLEAYNYFDVVAGKIGTDTFRKAGIGSADEYTEAFVSEMKRKMKQMSGLELDLEDRLIKTTNAKNLGLNLTEITQYQASIASITNAMGLAQETATATSKALSMLAADLGSLRNVDYQEVAQNLQSAMTGMARSVYRYGIDLTQATLEQYAYANGVEKSVSEMTQAEKAQLRLLAILDQSKVAWGDLANTVNSPSNQLRQLKNNFAEVGTVLGQLFIPIMQKTLPWINGLSIAIKKLLVDIASLLGIELNLDDFGKGFSDAIDEDTEAVDDLNKSMKETKKGIREFDELKVIGGDNSKAASGLADQIDLTQQILDATSEYEKVWDEAYERMQSKAQEIADALSGVFEPIKTLVEDFAIGDFFKAGEDFSGLVTSIFNYVSDAINSVNWEELGQKVGDFLAGLKWGEILKSIGGVIGSALQGALNLWQGSFSVAPFETALLSAFALLKFTGFGDIIKTGLSKAVSKQLKAKGLSKELSSALGKIGVVSLGIGIALTIDNVKSVKKGEYSAFSLKGLLKSMISSLFEGAGITLLAESIGLSAGAFTFSIAAAVALLVNLAVADASMDTPYESVKKVTEEEYKWVQDNNLERLEIITNIELRRGEVDTQFLQIDDLADKVYELSLNYDKLTDGEKGLLKYYSEELIGIMPELASSIDEVTGAYKGTREELDKLIESQKRQMLLEAYKDNASELLKGITSAESDIDKLLKSKSENVGKLFDVKSKFKEYMGEDFSEELWTYVVQYFMPENVGKDLSYLAPNVSEYTKYRATYGILDDAGEKIQKWTQELAALDPEKDAAKIAEIKSNILNSSDSLGSLIAILAESDTIKEGLQSTSQTLYELKDEYTFYEEKIGDILGVDIPKDIEDGNKKAADNQNKSKLPKAIETTIDKVDKKINDGKTVTSNDMNAMFNGINDSFKGLGNGKVPAEVQTTMDNIKKAIKDKSPELVQYMTDLKILMEKAFADAHYDSSGNMIWNPNQISARLGRDVGKIEEAVRYTNKPALGSLKDDLLELFGGTLPKEVDDSFKSLAKTIENGQGSQAVKSALSDLKTTFSKAAMDAGMYIDLGLGYSIDANGHFVYAAIDNVSDKSKETYKKNNEISSPSRVYRRLGVFIPEGIALGIEDGENDVDKAMSSLLKSVQAQFSGYKYNVPSLGLGVGNSSLYKGANTPQHNQNTTGLYEQMLAINNANSGQTEVVFRIEGDPHGMFKVIREQNDIYRRQTNGRSAF